MGNLLHCKDIVLGYEGNAVISGLNFNISEGDYLCILGENGSGKSTLMKAMLGLNKPISGMLIQPADMKPGDIGYLPQQTVVQKDFPASVHEIVISGCLPKCGLRPYYKKEEKQLAENTMARLGISELANRCYRELSGGQQQRVLLARALCAAQKILLLDEPVTGLRRAHLHREGEGVGGLLCIRFGANRGAAVDGRVGHHIRIVEAYPEDAAHVVGHP